ncbi:MAG: TMEM165/GDT1 family protein [Candidatus Eremiobacteraeota bacterium]|nr:TMEM165/GDT1 family protein [Candidatus Eremiobacteraeota bacterium]
MNGWTLAGTTFLASAVEAVEALTIVLAVGVTRSWPVSLRGAASALVVLAIIVAAFGPLLHFVPIDQLKLVVGIVLILFGLAWLRKAILRYSGRKALRDEDAAFAREVATMRAVEDVRADRIGLVTSFKAVLIEGLEVAIIVVTFGAASTAAFAWSAAGAAAAVLLVVALGFALKRPASRVPENTMKFVVGVMLTSFGTFWTGEGLGIAWWGADLALLVLAAFYLACAMILVGISRASRAVNA